MKFRVKTKQGQDFEFNGSLDQLINDLKLDEIPCKITNVITGIHMKVQKYKAFHGGYVKKIGADY